MTSYRSPRRRITRGFPVLAIFAAVALIGFAIFLVIVLTGDDPADNGHAKACTAAGFTIHEHEQWGGKWNTSTWWCTDRDDRITDVWFEGDE